jgi:5-formyltetrahydrofolate cyclo-ligase
VETDLDPDTKAMTSRRAEGAASPSGVMTEPERAPTPPATHATPEELVRTLAKRELRKRMRGVRKTTPASRIAERSAIVCALLREHPWVQAASAVVSFWPIVERHELDLRALHATLAAEGKKLYYPAIDPDSNVMTFRQVTEVAVLEERGKGFAEPPPDAPELVVDAAAEAPSLVLLVPALALDDAGRRLGYGAGYYDRTIPRFCPPGKTIGVAFSFQLLGELPVHPHDVPVDTIVTDGGVHVPSPALAMGAAVAGSAENPANFQVPGFDRREPGVTVVRRR